MSRLATGFISVYRRLASPLLGQRCRYYPSCSQYSHDAFRQYGFLRGVVLSVWRILRCNPLSAGGIDHVSNQHIFRG